MKKRIFSLSLCLLIAFQLLADWPAERKKIDYLIEQVGLVDGVFIRNGKEHTPVEAMSHLNLKLRRAINSWFAPDEEEWTAIMFIENVASKSSLSGKPYQIKLTSGEVFKSEEWLKRQLKHYPEDR